MPFEVIRYNIIKDNKNVNVFDYIKCNYDNIYNGKDIYLAKNIVRLFINFILFKYVYNNTNKFCSNKT